MTPKSNRLSPTDFRRMRDALAEVGLHLMHEEDAEKRLAEIRQLYEPFVNALADHLLINLPPWVVSERTVDDWQTSAWDHFAQWSPQKLEEITHIIVDHRKKTAVPHAHSHSPLAQGEHHSLDGGGR